MFLHLSCLLYFCSGLPLYFFQFAVQSLVMFSEIFLLCGVFLHLRTVPGRPNPPDWIRFQTAPRESRNWWLSPANPHAAFYFFSPESLWQWRRRHWDAAHPCCCLTRKYHSFLPPSSAPSVSSFSSSRCDPLTEWMSEREQFAVMKSNVRQKCASLSHIKTLKNLKIAPEETKKGSRWVQFVKKDLPHLFFSEHSQGI